MFSNSTHTNAKIAWRREMVFLLLAGLFLGSLTLLNILGITRIIQIPITATITMPLTVGVLAYPITFLCTDFISELYGKKRATMLVWIGLILNLWVLFILWLGGILPPSSEVLDANNNLVLVTDPTTGLPINDFIFYSINKFTRATIFASMIAYLLAQFCDVHIFHYLKKLTNGKHLWLRNNGSTIISQLVDSVAVILISHYVANAFSYQIFQNNGNVTGTLLSLIIAGYLFKFLAALLDTIPFYFGVKFLNKYLLIDVNKPLDLDENL